MGAIEDTNMPVGMTFASKAYADFALMSYAYAFDQAHHEGRFAPQRTPQLKSDIIPPIRNKSGRCSKSRPPTLQVHAEKLGLRGSVKMPATCGSVEYDLEVYVDGILTGTVKRNGTHWNVTGSIDLSFQAVSPFGEINVPDASLAMVVVNATTPNGRSERNLLFV
jgi:hypothetical protein